jgi:hypothetical protein
VLSETLTREVSLPVRRRALIAVLAVVMLAAAPAAAAPRAGTTVVVSLKTPAFHGKLKSSRGACRANRKVKLFRKKPGRDRLLGTDKTNAKAKWSIRIRLKSGASYYAKAPAKGSCKAAKSKVLSIG